MESPSKRARLNKQPAPILLPLLPSRQQPACQQGNHQSVSATLAHTGQDAADEEDSAWEEVADAMPSDLEASILFLRSQFFTHPGCSTLPPLVLRTQLCSILKDQTDLDRHIDELRSRNIVRMFKLATGADEHGMLLTKDYISLIQKAAADATPPSAQPQTAPSTAPATVAASPQAAAVASGAWSPHQHAAHAFISRVIPAHTHISISHPQLVGLLSRPPPAHQQHHHQQQHGQQQQQHQHQHQQPGQPLPQHHQRQQPQQAPPPPPPEEMVSLLLNLGAIARHTSEDGAYLLCVPGLGPVVRGIIAGRQELAALVSRKKYGEVAERVLLEGGGGPAGGGAGAGGRSGGRAAARSKAAAETGGGFLRPVGDPAAAAAAAAPAPASGALRKAGGVKLRQSVLGIEFHVRDLLGRGTLVRVDTPSGPMLRLKKGPGAAR